ncbi:hypothetical protein KBB06_02990 [Candidatus Gracilibacteria bacterium]|nr:hypothetical protein [Candidatus Gracilibacteria bacterium]
MPENTEQNREEYLKHLLKNLPHHPGVYKMKDKDGTCPSFYKRPDDEEDF